MSFELLYTSAPKGLKAGSRGFCTVMCTQGMPAPLMTALESLSAYRHVYPPGDRQAAKNPVAWSHLKMNVAARSYHVLSRVADYGLDYSQRGNKLAHHVAFEAAERSSGGPACLLNQTGNLQTDWDGQPRMLPATRQLRSAPRPPAVCTAWQALTGDAGWAGVLAESFLENPERQVYIVFAPGMDLLPLMAEAIALLPDESRWNVTFSTYFTSLPPGVTCAWRGVLSGSPEAEQGKKFGKALHIDLCQRVPPAVGGSLVEAARTGRAARPAAEGPQFANAGPIPAGGEPDAEWELRPTAEDAIRESTAEVPFPGFSTSPGGIEFGVARPLGMPPPPPPAISNHKRRTQADVARRQQIQLIIGGLIVTALGLCVAVLAVPALRDRIFKNGSSVASRDNADDDDAKTAGDRRSKPATRAKDRDDSHGPDESDDVARTHDGHAGSANGAGRSDKASADEGANPKSAADAPHSDEKLAANKSSPDERPAKDPNADKPDTAQKKDSPPQNVPRFGKRDLTVVREEADYSLYAFSLEEAINDGRELKVPMRDAKSCTWELFAAVGRPEIGFKQKGDDAKVATIPREEGVGSNTAEVLSVTRTCDHTGCTFQFDKQGTGWERVKWCLLSVSPPNAKKRLFALKEPTLTPGSRQFEAFSYAILLARKGSDEAIPTMFVDALEIACSDIEPRLRFENETGATHEGFLSCDIPPALASRILFAESDRRLDMKLTQTSEKVTAKMTSLASALNKIFDKGVEQQIEKIERQYPGFSSELHYSSRRDKLKNELHADRPEKRNPTPALDDLEGAIKTRIKDLQQELGNLAAEQRTAQQARIQDLNKMLADLKALETARDTFLKFREGLKNAEVRQLRLHYEFEPKADKGFPRRLSVRLEYIQQ